PRAGTGAAGRVTDHGDGDELAGPAAGRVWRDVASGMHRLPKRGRPRPDNRARPVTLTAWPGPGLGGVTQGAQLDAASIRPPRPGRGPGPGPPPATTWRRRNHAPRALGRAAPLVVAAPPPAPRAPARTRRGPARTFLRPGRGRAGRPGRPPPSHAPRPAPP